MIDVCARVFLHFSCFCPSRCNLAVILLTDVVVDSVDVDWSMHMPLMLHILFLGMDQSRNLINQHCKQLLLNLLIVLANHSDHLSVAQILLNRKVKYLGLGLPTPLVVMPFHNFTGGYKKLQRKHNYLFFDDIEASHVFTESDPTFDTYLQSPIGASQSTSLAVIPSPTSKFLLNSMFNRRDTPRVFLNLILLRLW